MRVLLICPKKNTFVMRDLEMLQKIFAEVDLVVFPTENKLKLMFNLAKNFIQSLFKIRKYDYVMSWFVGYHSVFPFLLAKLYRKKTVAFLGGTECHNFPEFDYGNYRKKGYALATRLSLRSSDFILPVHESLIYTYVDYEKVIYPEQGVLAFNKNIKGVLQEVYCGFEKQKEWKFEDKIENSFLTVSSNLFGMDYTRKGVDMTVQLAKAFPQFRFTLVGSGYTGEQLPNITVYNSISYEALIDVYRKHQFYLQLSIAEGFPNALAEAMLYGCIPIGSSVFGIPFIIGDTGFVVEKRAIDECRNTLCTALELGISHKKLLAIEASKRIQTKFTYGNRTEQFKNVLSI